MMIDSERKAELRSRYLEVRSNLKPRDVKFKSEQILLTLLETDFFTSSEVIHTYVSISSRNEVDTRELIKRCFLQEKTVVVPKIKVGGKLNHVELKSITDLKENSWGVAEPEADTPFNISKIGLVIVPMVAGDLQKNRLGYGKGYYDRFLNRLNAVKVGLLFENQLYSHTLPTEPFDIKLDFIITEKRIIE